MNYFAFGLVSLFAFLAAPAFAEDPTVGDIFRNENAKEFRGWKMTMSGSGESNAKYQTFDKGSREMLAVTKPLVHTARGGYEVEEIVFIKEIFRQQGEIRMFDCRFLNLDPPVVFSNAKTRVARGYFVFPDNIEIRRWLVDDLSNCNPGGE